MNQVLIQKKKLLRVNNPSPRLSSTKLVIREKAQGVKLISSDIYYYMQSNIMILILYFIF